LHPLGFSGRVIPLLLSIHTIFWLWKGCIIYFNPLYVCLFFCHSSKVSSLPRKPALVLRQLSS
jgi:hypothetical protein